MAPSIMEVLLMLIQEAIFPELDEKAEKPEIIKTEVAKEEQLEIKDMLPKEETPKNKGGRPRKN